MISDMNSCRETPRSSKTCYKKFDMMVTNQKEQNFVDFRVSFDEKATVADDHSLSRQRANNSRKSNRVRFSLDPADHCHPIKDTQDHGMLSRDLSASKTRISSDSGSFITPDRRSFHLSHIESDKNNVSSKIPASHKNSGSNDYEEVARDELLPSARFPHTNDAYTPLHPREKSLDLQSEIKSKRLFHNSIAEFRSDIVTPHLPSKMIKLPFEENTTDTCSKINLGHFALRKWTREKCLKNGVRDVTLCITSANANKLRFGLDDGLPLFIVGQRDVPKCKSTGNATDVKKWLIGQGCDESLFTDNWIRNHYRWIVWKLAAMERSFSNELGGRYLVYDHLLKQMKERYEKELQRVQRPAVRKLLNRDVSSCMPIILCVSQILRFRTKSDRPGVNIEEIRLELTDGWYALSASLDIVLLQFVKQQKIKVGTKLFICNGQLVGAEDGLDPLDDDYSSSRRNCPLCIAINANSTRLARWNAKLGFVSERNVNISGGSLVVKSLRDVFVNGGPIPAIDLIVCKRYPKMYLEEVNGLPLHITEAEDAVRQMEYSTKHQRESEKFVETAQQECSEVSSVILPSSYGNL